MENKIEFNKIVKDAAQLVKQGNLKDAEKLYLSIVDDTKQKDNSLNKLREIAILEVGQIYVQQENAQAIKELLKRIRPLFDFLPKSKTAKIVKKLLELVELIPNSLKMQLELVKDSIDWSTMEKRRFLRQRLETRLAFLYFSDGQYKNALELLAALLSEVKKLDDKQLLVETQLLESRVQHRLRNVARARAALTAARTAANSIYLEQDLQAHIDMQAGILHAEEKDYKTAYSYFFEAFEGYSSLKTQQAKAVYALKYMLLCKVMSNNVADIKQIMHGKMALKYNNDEINAMVAIANSYQDRSLKEFYDTKEQYKQFIEGDPIVNVHLSALYDNLVEQNLLRIIEPYSCCEISYISKKIDLDSSKVEKKLSQMILDGKFKGTLDQNTNTLTIFELPSPDKVYTTAIDTVHQMNKVVQSLFDMAAKLT